jgi:hypothetical protein
MGSSSLNAEVNAGKMLWSFQSALYESFVDDHLRGDIRQFASLPRFYLLSHRLEVPLHFDPRQPRCSR